MEMEGVPDGEVAGMPRRPVRAAAQTLPLLLDLKNPDWGMALETLPKHACRRLGRVYVTVSRPPSKLLPHIAGTKLHHVASNVARGEHCISTMAKIRQSLRFDALGRSV